jgi:hypothetical protein
MSEITVFDVIDEEAAVLPSFLKVLLEFSAYDSFIIKTGNTMKYKEILCQKYEILGNTLKYQEISFKFFVLCLTQSKKPTQLSS